MPEPDDVVTALEKLRQEVKELREEVLGRGEDRLLTAKEAAKITGLTERAVRMQAYRGSIPFVRVGNRHIRFKRSDLIRKP